MSSSLVILLAVPLVGAAVGAFMKSAAAARAWALVVTLVTGAVSVAVAAGFDWSRPADTQFGFAGWSLPGVGFGVSLGVDAVGLSLLLLTTGLMPLAVVASFGSIKERQTEYYAWMVALLFAMLGVFVARDALLFYVFFELTLVPMFFIIGIWGGPERRHAAGRFFLFTFAGSVFTLAATVYLGLRAGSFDINEMAAFANARLTDAEQFWVLMGLLAGFAVKVPLFPVHTWLPLAHTEAPTAGSVILAGVLLKLGTYGLLRLAVPIGLVTFAGTVGVAIAVVCVVGILYGALVAWVQQDIKKLVAYSSVSHLGFCVLGLVALNDVGMQGSILYMINHGISTGAMFLVIGMVYDRFHTRDINELSGLGRKMPVLASFFVFFVMSSVGLPGTNGFWSEFSTVLGAFTSDTLGIAFGVVAALGVILGAVYMLHMTARVIFGPLKYPGSNGGHDDAHGHGHGQQSHGQAADAHAGHHGDAAGDITGREIGILVPLAVAVLVLGVYPTPLMRSWQPVVENLRGYGRPAMTAADAGGAGDGAGTAVSLNDVTGVPAALD